VDDPLQLVT